MKNVNESKIDFSSNLSFFLAPFAVTLLSGGLAVFFLPILFIAVSLYLLVVRKQLSRRRTALLISLLTGIVFCCAASYATFVSMVAFGD